MKKKNNKGQDGEIIMEV